MSETKTILFDSGSEFTFDSDKIEIVGSNAQLKNDGPLSGQTFVQTFDSDTGFT